MSIPPGPRLGPYEIVQLRGKGGMGEVHRALDSRLEREVAIRVLPERLGDLVLIQNWRAMVVAAFSDDS